MLICEGVWRVPNLIVRHDDAPKYIKISSTGRTRSPATDGVAPTETAKCTEEKLWQLLRAWCRNKRPQKLCKNRCTEENCCCWKGNRKLVPFRFPLLTLHEVNWRILKSIPTLLLLYFAQYYILYKCCQSVYNLVILHVNLAISVCFIHMRDPSSPALPEVFPFSMLNVFWWFFFSPYLNPEF